MADSGQILSFTRAGGIAQVTGKRTEMSTAAATLDEVLTIPVDGIRTIAVQIAPTVRALDQFAIKGKFHRDGAFVTLFSAAGDYTSPAGLMIDASWDLTAQGAATIGWFIMDVRGLYEVQILVSGTVDGTGLIDIYANGVSP